MLPAPRVQRLTPEHITEVEGVPTVRHEIAAERLGMVDASGRLRADNLVVKIRQAQRDFEHFGLLLESQEQRPRGDRGGSQSVTVYHLNELQFLLTLKLCSTDKANQIYAEVVEVFMAWRQGSLVPSLPRATPALDMAALGTAIGAQLAPVLGDFAGRMELAELGVEAQQGDENGRSPCTNAI